MIKGNRVRSPDSPAAVSVLLRQAPWSLTIFGKTACHEFEDASQKTCRCHLYHQKVMEDEIIEPRGLGF